MRRGSGAQKTTIASSRALSAVKAAARWILDGSALVALATLSVLPVLDLVLARLFWRGIPSSGTVLQYSILALAFLSAAIATREGRQLSLGSGAKDGGRRSPAKELPAWRRILVRAVALGPDFARAVEAGAVAAFAWTSLSFVFAAFDKSSRVLFLPERWFVAAMPFGFFLMLAFVLARKGRGGRLAAWAGALAGTFLAASAIANLASVLEAESAVPGGLASALGPVSAAAGAVLSAGAWPVAILILAGALAGAPIFCVLGGLALLFLGGDGSYLELASSEAYALLRGPAIPALPLFALSGYLLAESGAGGRLVAVFRELFGWLPGGEAIAAVLACAFLTTFTGANGVTILALGGLLAAVLSEAGPYEPGFSRGLVTASGAIGLLLPPSAAVIVYGINAQFIYGEGSNIDITSLFLGALVPGLLLILAMCGAGVYAARRSGVPRRRFDPPAARAALKPALLELLTPGIAALLFFTGLASLTEIGAICVLYLSFVEGAVKRELGPAKFLAAARNSLAVIGGTLIIIASARGLSFYLIDADIPSVFTVWATSHAATRFSFLLLLNLSLLVVGCLMDIYSAILVAAPLVIPLGAAFGLHPVHLGVVFILNLCIGFLTPPVGMNLFFASYAFKKPLREIFRETWPFFALQLLVLVLVTYLPWLSTFILPR